MTDDRIPTVFSVPQKSEVVNTPQDTVPKSIIPPIILNSNEINVDICIKTLKKDIKELEQLRVRKYSEKKYSIITKRITTLSSKINNSLDQLVKQTPINITSKDIYDTPDVTEVNNLLRTQKELFAEIRYATMSGFAGGLLSAIAGLLPYEIISTSNESLKHFAITLPSTFGIYGAYFFGSRFKLDTDHLSPLFNKSSERTKKANILLKYLNETYNKGSIDNRVELRVKELTTTGADISSAIITYINKNQKEKLSLYDSMLNSKIVYTLGNYVTDRINKTRILSNIPDLIRLEKELGINKTVIDYKNKIEEGITLFNEANLERDFNRMKCAARTILDLSHDYIIAEKLTSAEESHYKNLKDEALTAIYDSTNLVELNLKLLKSKSDVAKAKYKAEIEEKYHDIYSRKMSKI